MTDKENELTRRALLGDETAQMKLTEQGKLLPCPCCGGEAKLKKGFPSKQIAHCRQAVVQCKKCGVRTVTHKQLPMERWQDVDNYAITDWNTRPPLVVFCKHCKYRHNCTNYTGETGVFGDYDFCSQGERESK